MLNHLAQPASFPLYKAAIIESGACAPTSFAPRLPPSATSFRPCETLLPLCLCKRVRRRYRCCFLLCGGQDDMGASPMSVAETGYKNVLRKTGCSNLACLRAKTTGNIAANSLHLE